MGTDGLIGDLTDFDFMTKAQQIEAALALVEKLQTNETWTIGDAIRLIRVEKGLSLTDIKGHGMNQATVCRIESGKEMRFGTLTRMSAALGCGCRRLWPDGRNAAHAEPQRRRVLTWSMGKGGLSDGGS